MSTNKLMKLEGYTTNLGLVFKQSTTGYYQNSICVSYIINGKPIAEIRKLNTIKTDTWYLLEGESQITSVKQKVKGTREQVGWVLSDPEIASKKIPLKLSLEDLARNWDSEYEESTFSGKYAKFATLYVEEYVVLADEIVDVEFEYKNIASIQVSDLNQPEKMTIRFVNEGTFGSSKVQEVDLSSIVHFHELEELLTPSFMLHTRPVKLQSKQVYSIVRHFIRSISDTHKFTIDSDYDFCFSVSKVIHTKPYMTTAVKTVRKGKGWAHKNVPAESSTKKVKIFQMTYAGYNGKASGYEGYTPITEWSANSLQELHDNIKEYLEELKVLLLSDTTECECCKGVGFNVQYVETNNRKV
jgi:hypothetical protein